jgi:hypothetical protein
MENTEEAMRKLSEECDTSLHIFVKDGQLILVHSPFDSEEEVINILNSTIANMVTRQTLDRVVNTRLQ